jgi:NodT family efflux transporter outer membrane factor (OMF) lipoprotein
MTELYGRSSRGSSMSEIVIVTAAPPGGDGEGRRRSAAWAAAAGALALAACASLPPSSPVRQANAARDLAAGRSFAAAPADWPGDGWWRAYGDPRLDALEEEALAGSPDLAEALARVRKSEALAREARAADAPQLAADALAQQTKLSYNNGIPPAFNPRGYNDETRLALDFSWELDFWGKNRAAVAAAVSEARAARAEAAQARLMLAASVADAYADLARLYAERDVAARAVAVRQEALDLSRRRRANGLDTQQTLDQALAGPPAAQGDVDALDEQIAQTRDRLAALTGAGPDRGLAITRPAPAGLKPFGLPERLAADLIGRRPDVVAARWRAEAAGGRVREARAAFYPNVNLAAYIGAQALHVSPFAPGSDIGEVGPALSLPILDGGRLRAELRGAQADHDAAVAAYDGAVSEALRQVADVAASERALSTRLPEARQALAADEAAWRIAGLRYQGGVANYASVLLAEQAVLTQRRATADLESRALTLDIALVRALGGGFAQP